MNYDSTTIPANYDAGRSLSPEMLARWMELVASHSSAAVRPILDLGCGTGRFAVPLAAHFSAAVVEVDPSAKMLAQARRDPHVHFVQGQGEHIPLRDRAVDLVFTSMAYHHFTQPRVVATRRDADSDRRGLGAREPESRAVPHRPSSIAGLRDQARFYSGDRDD